MPASPSRVSGFAALFASLGLHAALLGLVVARSLSLPEPAAASWTGGTFEISTLSEADANGVVVSAEGSSAGVVPAESEASASAQSENAARAEATSAFAQSEDAARAEPSAGAARRDEAGEPQQVKVSDAAVAPSATAGARSRKDDSRSIKAGDETPRPTPARAADGVHSTSGGPSNGDGAPPPAGGAYGAAGMDARKGSLPDAFTRALPMAARGAAWRALPAGPAGRFVVVASLDDEGAVEKLTPLGSAPPHVLELTRSLGLLLRAGRFAAPPEGGVQGYRLGVSALIDRVAPSPDESAAPDLVRELSFQKLAADKPGSATLVYNSGRRVRFEVIVDPTWPAP